MTAAEELFQLPVDPVAWAQEQIEKRCWPTLPDQTGDAIATETCSGCSLTLRLGQICPHCGLLAGY